MVDGNKEVCSNGGKEGSGGRRGSRRGSRRGVIRGDFKLGGGR